MSANSHLMSLSEGTINGRCQYPLSPRKSTGQKTSQTGQHSGDADSMSGEEEEGNADDEDSSAEPDDQDQDDEEPEAFAPSGGAGKGKGKGPAIRISRTGETQETEDCQTGLKEDSLSAQNHLPTKKRTLSNVSAASVLTGSDEENHVAGSATYPRKKANRQLSNVEGGLLTYGALERPNLASVNGDAAENAIADSSDDEDYNGVDLISDDEDEVSGDLDMLEQIEEDAILREFDGENLFPLDIDCDAFLSTFEDTTTDTDKGVDVPTRRVRFDDEVQIEQHPGRMSSPSSSSSGSDTMDFPDIFEPRDKLEQRLHSSASFFYNLANDESMSDGDGSYYDYEYWGDGNIGSAPALLDHDVHTEESDGGSGYESDHGSSDSDSDSDETDEEEQPPIATIRPKVSSLHHRVGSSSTSSENVPTPQESPRSTAPTKGRKGPHLGSFQVKPNKCYAFVDPKGNQLILRRASRPDTNSYQPSPQSTAASSPQTAFATLATDGSDSELSQQAMLAHLGITDVMVSALFSDLGSHSSLVGHPEAFYPMANMVDGVPIIDTPSLSDDTDEENLNIADFITVASDDSDIFDDTFGDITDEPISPTTPLFGSFSADQASDTPSHRRNSSQNLLEHFDRAPVTAFRNNQDRARTVSRYSQNPNLRTSSSTAVRKGKTAQQPITPPRRSRTNGAPAHRITKPSSSRTISGRS